MSTEPDAADTPLQPEPFELEPEIAHLLLIDIVGYSTLFVNTQIERVQELTRIVRETECVRRAETKGRLLKVPTGDGMALLFFHSPEEPVRCALEIARSLKEHPQLHVRMGVHSGPVNSVTDVNDRSNVAGAGINIAQRVMDCGDAGHILLSRHVADDLEQYSHWQPFLHDLGECEVKHGLRLRIANLCKDGLGNPSLPEKLRRFRTWRKDDGPHRVRRMSRLTSNTLTIVGLLSLVAVAIGTWKTLRGSTRQSARKQDTVGALPIAAKSIAVLPFQNLSNNQENVFFADGVQNEIMTDLAKVADLKVISRTSVMQFRDVGSRNVREIASELGVAHVLEGSVQRFDHTVRVTAELIDARTDTHLWGESYDRAVADVFGIETELAEQIVAQLKARLSGQEKAAIEEQPTRDLEAYDLYLQARDLINAIAFSPKGKEILFQAVDLLNDAVRRDPNFARAYYELAGAHDRIYFLGFDHSPERLEMAKAAIDALALLRPDSGEAHLAQAQHSYWGYRDYARAREELVSARKALPNEPLVLLLQGYIDRREGRWDESIKEMEQALALDPRNAFILQQVSFTYSRLRRYSDEAAALDKVLTIVPNDVSTRLQRAVVDLNARADVEPLRSAIALVAEEGPVAMANAATYWLTLAQDTRDSKIAEQALAHTPAEGTNEADFHAPKAYWEGVLALALHDQNKANDAFTRARPELERLVREQPGFAPPLSLLGLTDAFLGRKVEAIAQGKRAVEILPVSRDALSGAELVENLATIYAWAGERQLAYEQLQFLSATPSGLTYGTLRLNPFWDPLRGDPLFDQIVASLAPK